MGRNGPTIRNLVLSLVLSLALTFVSTVIYVFYPVLSLIVKGILARLFDTDTDGVAAVAGGVSDTTLLVALVTASTLFLLIFTLLQRRSDRR